MIIVADQNLPLLHETFGRHAELRLHPGREIEPAHLEGATALLVKSITRVDRALLEDSDIRFVGSATIGHDHLDLPWLEANRIAWVNAPGCNANAAAQYTLAMYLLARRRLRLPARGETAAIFGRGNVGSRVLSALQTLGVDCVACDPPLADQGVKGLVSMAQALECDAVFVHVPLTRTGPYPTHRMFDRRALAAMRDGALLINTARGNVVDGSALLEELRNCRLSAALDVWPGEPNLDPALLDATTVATPHVAGYSEQGRLKGALMIYHAFCRWQRIRPILATVPEPPLQELQVHSSDDALHEAVVGSSRVAVDDRHLRNAVHAFGRRCGEAFDTLRRTYPSRHEFRFWQVSGVTGQAARRLAALGFRLDRRGG